MKKSRHTSIDRNMPILGQAVQADYPTEVSAVNGQKLQSCRLKAQLDPAAFMQLVIGLTTFAIAGNTPQ